MAGTEESQSLTKLNQEFTYWFTFFKKSKDKQLEEFEDNLKTIGTFSSAEEFWGIYQHMKRPNSLPRGCEFFLFKKGIKPLWEDTPNIGGGRFYISMKKSPVTNKLWEDLQVAFILTDAQHDAINGIVLNVRTSEVFISVWTKRIDDEQILKIKEWIKEALDLPNEQCIEYKKHPNNEQLIQKQEDLTKEEEERKRKAIEAEKKKQEDEERKRARTGAERLDEEIATQIKEAQQDDDEMLPKSQPVGQPQKDPEIVE
jgi:translation initiation factor 4E